MGLNVTKTMMDRYRNLDEGQGGPTETDLRNMIDELVEIVESWRARASELAHVCNKLLDDTRKSLRLHTSTHQDHLAEWRCSCIETIDEVQRLISSIKESNG